MARTKTPPPPPRLKTALEGHRLNAFGRGPFSMKLVGHDPKYPKGHPLYDPDLRDGPEHPLYDARIEDINTRGRAAVEYLIPSILEEGYIHWPLVRKNGDEVEVGVGRNRVFAGRIIVEAGLWTSSEPFEVPVVKKDYNDERWRAVILAENLKRKDSDPIAEALQLAEFVKHHPSSKRLRELVGMSPREVDRFLAVIQMPPDVQARVVSLKIPRPVAIELARMNTRDQGGALTELTSRGLVTVEAARAIADRSLGIAPSTPRLYYLPDEVVAPEGGGAPTLAAGVEPITAAPPAAPVVANDAGPRTTPPAPAAKPEGPAKFTKPPADFLRDLLAEIDEKGTMMGDEPVAMLRYVLTGDEDAIKAVPKLAATLKRAMARYTKRHEARQKAREERLSGAPDG